MRFRRTISLSDMKSCLIKNCRKCRRRLALCKCVEPVTQSEKSREKELNDDFFERLCTDRRGNIDLLRYERFVKETEFWLWAAWKIGANPYKAGEHMQLNKDQVNEIMGWEAYDGEF